MKTLAMTIVALSVIATNRMGSADDQETPPAAKNALPTIKSQVDKSQPESSVRSTDRSAKESSDRDTFARQLTADEEAIVATSKTYCAAYDKGDAAAAAAHYTADAEYVDSDGNRYEGRPAIQKVLSDYLMSHRGCKLNMEIDSIRIISPGVAIEEGYTSIAMPEDSNSDKADRGKANSDEADQDNFESSITAYAAVHVKQDGKWLTASVRERAVKVVHEHRAQLRQLHWMLGDWVHEGDNSIVRFTCRPVDHGNFLVRTFAVYVGGRETMTGSQRIGWDSRAAKFRAWVFDSAGGYSEGYFHRDGDSWVLKQVGVTAEGQPASSTSIYTPVDARSMTFQSVDHEVDGAELGDSEPVTIVRQFSQPE